MMLILASSAFAYCPKAFKSAEYKKPILVYEDGSVRYRATDVQIQKRPTVFQYEDSVTRNVKFKRYVPHKFSVMKLNKGKNIQHHKMESCRETLHEYRGTPKEYRNFYRDQGNEFLCARGS